MARSAALLLLLLLSGPFAGASDPPRVVAIGGWIGKRLVVVQLGDQLDRGDDEPEVLALLERVEKAARPAGGRVITLNGNHELPFQVFVDPLCPPSLHDDPEQLPLRHAPR